MMEQHHNWRSAKVLPSTIGIDQCQSLERTSEPAVSDRLSETSAVSAAGIPDAWNVTPYDFELKLTRLMEPQRVSRLLWTKFGDIPRQFSLVLTF
jgi:hypothetical protein